MKFDFLTFCFIYQGYQHHLLNFFFFNGTEKCNDTKDLSGFLELTVGPI